MTQAIYRADKANCNDGVPKRCVVCVVTTLCRAWRPMRRRHAARWKLRALDRL